MASPLQTSPAVEAERLLRAGDPMAALGCLQTAVRAAPQELRLRVFLFQLLSVLGQWERAAMQLDLCAELDRIALPMRETYRPALDAEPRRQMLADGLASATSLSAPPAWLVDLIESRRLLALGRWDDARAMREHALAQAPAGGGLLNGAPFEWIADADGRFGPVLEVIVQGRVRWLPFESIAAVDAEPPADLRDAVWLPVMLTLATGAQTPALIPSRYPGTADGGDGALRLGWRTEWREDGSGAQVGFGQRVLITDATELPLLQLRTLRMGATPTHLPSPADAQGAEAHGGSDG